MKEALFALFLFSSLGQEISFDVILPEHTQAIISSYRNANFTQEVRSVEKGTLVSISSRNYLGLILNDRIFTDYAFVEKTDPLIAAAYNQLISKSIFLKNFMENLSIFLRGNLAYSDASLPQDAASVLKQGGGSCIGFTNLTQSLLSCAGIQSRPAKGFFLKFNRNQAEPTSHRWLEITLARRFRFFYDPQYQNFSGRYILVNESVAFDQIERFNGIVVALNRRVNGF